MKSLVNAQKNRLKTALPYLKAVFVLPVDALFPPESATPALGLRDAGTAIVRTFETEQVAEELITAVDIFVENLRDVEAPVMGDAQVKGVLDIAADVRATLNDQLFTDPPDSLDFQDAYIQHEDPPVLFVYPDTDKEIIKKTLTFLYRRIRAR